MVPPAGRAPGPRDVTIPPHFAESDIIVTTHNRPRGIVLMLVCELAFRPAPIDVGVECGCRLSRIQPSFCEHDNRRAGTGWFADLEA